MAGALGAGAQAYPTFVLLDDAFAHPEAQAGAFFVLGGEEGVEDFPDGIAGDAGAVIGNGDAYAAVRRPFPLTAGGDADFDRGGAGLEGIADEVQEYLAQFAGEAEYGGGGAVVGLNDCPGLGGLAGEESDRGVDGPGEVEWAGRFAIALELMRLASDMGDATELLADSFQNRLAIR